MYNVIIAGSTDFTVDCIKKTLSNTNINLCGIIAPPDTKKDRKGKIVLSDVSLFAKEQHIPLFRPEKINDEEFKEKLEALEIDIMIVVAYGQILSPATLSIPKIDSINIHGSLLPDLRGASPIESALIEGYTRTGVTLQRMSAKLDEGDILLQKEIKIKGDWGYEELYDAVKEAGAYLLGLFLNDVENTVNNAQAQDKRKATYCKKIKKEEGKLDFTKKAKELHNQVRAYSTWPVCYASYKDEIIRIYKTNVIETNKPEKEECGLIIDVLEAGIHVQTGNGILVITELQRSGKKKQSAKDFINGAKIHRGDMLR